MSDNDNSKEKIVRRSKEMKICTNLVPLWPEGFQPSTLSSPQGPQFALEWPGSLALQQTFERLRRFFVKKDPEAYVEATG